MRRRQGGEPALDVVRVDLLPIWGAAIWVEWQQVVRVGLCWRGGAFDVALLADGANGAGPSFQVAHTGGGGSFQIGPAGGDGTALEQGGPAVAFDMVPGSNFELCEAS